MSRMFKTVDKTWNVFTGCLFECDYCWARKQALGRLRHVERYKNGFKPSFNEKELLKTFPPGLFIFVADMGDIAWAAREQVIRILQRIREFPETYFLLQTKNPFCFGAWEVNFPPNVYLGTTIETNRRQYVNFRSKAPSPVVRFRDLAGYPHNRKFLSIEPIMDFDPKELLNWIELLQPDIIEVGADNYHNNLPEPNPFKLEFLLTALRDICPRVIEKEGLERLKRG